MSSPRVVRGCSCLRFGDPVDDGGRLNPPEEAPTDVGRRWDWTRQGFAFARTAVDSAFRLSEDVHRLQKDLASHVGYTSDALGEIKDLGGRMKVLEQAYQRGMGVWVALAVIGPVIGTIIGGLILYKLTGR